jgi:transposase-like protein
LFFYIHTSFVRISLVCDIGINTLKSIFDDIALIDVDIGGVIELDEMYIKSGLKGKHYSGEIKKLGREPRKRGLKRRKRGRGTYDEDLCPLLTIIDRESNFILVPIKKASTKEIKPEVINHCDMDSTFYTDEWRSYNFLDNREYVNHSEKEYSRGDVHINTAEGMHNLFRIFMYVHMGVNKRNLHKYIKWFIIMETALQKKDKLEILDFFVSLLVSKRK